MRIPKRAAFRLALTGGLGLAVLALAAPQGRAEEAPEKAHPGSTVLFAKVNNAAGLREAFRQSQFGRLWADPALKPFREDLASRLDERGKTMKQTLGVGLRELIELPQGAASIAVVAKDQGDAPFAVVLTADAGKNAAAMTGVLTRATEQGEKAGAKISKEQFKGQTLYVIQPPKPKDDKDGDKPAPPVVWTNAAGKFTIGTDVEVVKDLVAHAGGRDDSLAASESYGKAVAKVGADAQVIWYLDVARALQLAVKVGSKGKNAANVKQLEPMAQVLGLDGLKAAAGSFTLNAGKFDSVSKTFVLAPAPVRGVLKLFSMPAISLKPEPWVPETVASYQTWSWDLDNAYAALNDLANMFQPGVLNVLEQQLVGPNGGEPLNFKKDIFDPLGDRVTVISDFKKPVTEDSQRMLVAVALEDQEKNPFQNTLNRLIGLANGQPKKREFQGATIYDFDMPELPNANANPNAGKVQLKGPVSVTVAKNTLFISSDPTLLEQVLRGGGASLADSASFQAVAKEVPEKVSNLNYVRPDEQARLSYEMVKSGQFEKALQGAAAAGGPDVGKVGKLFDKDKLPDFSVFAKYLSQGGGYGVMADDGMTFTSFTLRKANP
jgi:hypothetical protein